MAHSRSPRRTCSLPSALRLTPATRRRNQPLRRSKNDPFHERRLRPALFVCLQSSPVSETAKILSFADARKCVEDHAAKLPKPKTIEDTVTAIGSTPWVL